jgi:hypothetical protein
MPAPPVLSQAEVATFKTRGYLLYHHQLLPDVELDRLEAIFDEHRGRHPEKAGDEFDTPHFEDGRLFDFLLAEPVLDLVESLIGPNIALWSSHFISKDPRIGRATPWHEDSTYWKGRLDRYDKIVTVWLALDDSNRDNGCMQVIPGSHLSGGLSDYRPVDREMNTFATELNSPDLEAALPFELRRGECSLHDGRIMHGADPNTSDRRRLGYTMRYISAELHVSAEMNAGHRLWLARGHAVASNVYQNA